MNLLILPSWYPDKDNEIRGIFFKQQVEALQRYCKENGIPISITVFFFRIYGLREIKSYLRSAKRLSVSCEDGLETWRFCYLNVFVRMYSYFVKYAGKSLRKCINKIQSGKGCFFDLVHVHSVFDIGVIYNQSGASIPYIITEHSSRYARGMINPVEKTFISNCLKDAHSIIAVSKGLAYEMKKITDKDIKIIFNMVKAIENTHIENLNSSFIFFSVGLKSKIKGFDILIQAFSHVWQRYNCSLIIGGITENELVELKDLQKKCSIPDERCTLLGRLPHEAVLKYMSECSCFVLTSRFETFGIVYAEAMYLGKPVIGTKTGGPDSFIVPEVGLTVKVEDVEETANAMKYVIEHYSDYNSNKISEYAKNNFSEEKICEQLIEIYKPFMG